MMTSTILLAVMLAGQNQTEPAHEKNSVFLQVLEAGLESGGQKVVLPKPRLNDGQDASAQRAALREVTASDRALEDLLRDSVTAPYVMKVRDVKTADSTIRVADLWFVVYAELKQVDFAQEMSRADPKPVEVANMWFEARLLKDAELKAAGVKTEPAAAGQNQWYTHIHAKLLDRIEFEATSLIVASQTSDSIVVASRTDPAFAKAAKFANNWRPISRGGGGKSEAEAKPYDGGISYARVSRLALKPGAVLVEMHTAFVEPDAWFQGARSCDRNSAWSPRTRSDPCAASWPRSGRSHDENSCAGSSPRWRVLVLRCFASGTRQALVGCLGI